MSAAFDDSVAVIIKAANFSAIKHKDGRRKDKEKTPYINHPIGVANLLVTVGKVTDTEMLVAALLHDTVEDTSTTIDEVKQNFGESVANIVMQVTDDKSLPKDVRKRLQIERATSLEPKARLIRLADKLYNLKDILRQTPEGWSDERVQEYFQWAAEVVKQILGTNEALESQLKDVLLKKGITI
ncbi:guanosine-3' [Dinothrombium tinctorium]|uniref:Guanosine-3',5'-bis(diphosphate) 3'-pyrophosphohydrolase MESH1 n=1 Tax=Dinothrombium tinctorium TaxID=1965070 RepID=A0A443R6J0_9ACAR|nr:guanosine-3' [Dinothrombium tinctorium]